MLFLKLSAILFLVAFVFVSVESSPQLISGILRGLGAPRRPRYYTRKEREYLQAAQSLNQVAASIKATEQPKIIIQMVQNTNVKSSDDDE